MLYEEEKVIKPMTKSGIVKDTVMLNVRSKISLTSEIVTTLNKDDEVEIDMKFQDPRWYKLKSPVVGYVLSKYINVKE